MAKLPQLKALEKISFERARQSGSHVIFKHPDGRRTTVSVHPTKTILTGTLRRIIEDSGLTEEEFLKLI